MSANHPTTGPTTSTAPAQTEHKPAHAKAKLIKAPLLIPFYKNENKIDEYEVTLKQGTKEFTLRGATAEKAMKAAKKYLEGESKYDG